MNVEVLAICPPSAAAMASDLLLCSARSWPGFHFSNAARNLSGDRPFTIIINGNGLARRQIVGGHFFQESSRVLRFGRKCVASGRKERSAVYARAGGDQYAFARVWRKRHGWPLQSSHPRTSKYRTARIRTCPHPAKTAAAGSTGGTPRPQGARPFQGRLYRGSCPGQGAQARSLNLVSERSAFSVTDPARPVAGARFPLARATR
jgi:hypothetical protein